MKLSLIAACGRNRVIGIENRLPWNLPDDLKYFRAKTSGHPVIMGRKTYESIGRPLPNRLNIVVSRRSDYKIPGVTVVSTMTEAYEASKGTGTSEAFVIGGSEIYALALDHADRLYLTLVDAAPEGDAYFPEWRNHGFKEVSREHHRRDEKHEFDFDWVIFEK